MKSAINKLFWGFILIFFNINIGRFDLLPNFIGYIVIINGLVDLKKLSDEDEIIKVFNIGTILGSVMVVISILSWFIPDNNINNMYGYGPSILNIIFNGVSTAIVYSLDYFILKGMSVMLCGLGNEELAYTSDTLKELIIGLGMVTVGFMSFTINLSQNSYIMSAVAVIVAIVGFIINIYYLYFIRKVYKEL